ncbi:MAG: nucleoside hydrolase [Clostridia bacterium]|nr:nucleoside hydrolase [Clostridia bacterium]
MTEAERLQNLSVPTGPIDVVLDTDAYNEIDDQFAIAYLLSCKEKLTTKALYAAPFFNENSTGPADGMEKSYDEILKLLSLMGEEVPVFKGSNAFLTDEKTPIASPAALDLAERANAYSPEAPLYVVAIGAITNVASAILLNPKVAENTVVVWLGGHALHYSHTKEFNMQQDVAAARVVMGCGVPFVQLPCMGVVSHFCVSKPELEYWLKGKSKIADYLAQNTINCAESYAAGRAWTRCLWDVTAIAWLVNDGGRFMESRLVPLHLPTYDHYYAAKPNGHLIRYVYNIHRDNLMTDLMQKLSSAK